jgi:hypothetical protein
VISCCDFWIDPLAEEKPLAEPAGAGKIMAPS